jgi:hypothetical protein
MCNRSILPIDGGSWHERMDQFYGKCSVYHELMPHLRAYVSILDGRLGGAPPPTLDLIIKSGMFEVVLYLTRSYNLLATAIPISGLPTLRSCFDVVHMGCVI